MIAHIDVELPKTDTRRTNEESGPENEEPEEVEGQSSSPEAVWMSKVDGPFEGCNEGTVKQRAFLVKLRCFELRLSSTEQCSVEQFLPCEKVITARKNKRTFSSN